MNFFEHQERARRKTVQLAILFGIAVLGIVFAVYVVARLAAQYAAMRAEVQVPFSFWDTETFLAVAVAVTLFIALASAFKIASLGRGGSAVAEMLGGRLVSRNTGDAAERRLLNIVDEMALASGVPVPQVYVLEQEQGINAFAAGHTTSDAAVAVTRGTLDLLNRDELQGVIAHEFSHVLNGDMRLNIQLIGIVFGILAIGIFGRILMHSGGRSRRSGGGIALAGLALMLIGYIGTFVGRLIQSAVSRQREFLADSSSVQFTRNPQGIAGALKKIGGYAHGSRIETPRADQARHIFFSPGRNVGFFEGLLATHPSLFERIRRIDPAFDGTYPHIAAGEAPERGAARADEARAAAARRSVAAGPDAGAPTLRGAFGPAGAVLAGAMAAELLRDPRRVAERIGQPQADDLRAGAALLAGIPPAVREALSSPDGAARVMLALLLDDDAQARERQFTALQPIMPPPEIAALREIHPAVKELPHSTRLPLADLALPALRQLPDDQVQRFLGRLKLAATIDDRITLFEFTLQWLLSFRLLRAQRRPKIVAHSSFASVRTEVLALLAALAYASSDDPAAAGRAFQSGVRRIPELAGPATSLPAAPPAFEIVGQALHRLVLASPEIKQALVIACAHCAIEDRRVTADELELLRVVSLALDCPLPPFVPVTEGASAEHPHGG
ncbi:MAG: M48 family metallopeptidase [Candidatus Eisenbacteria bacterium]